MTKRVPLIALCAALLLVLAWSAGAQSVVGNFISLRLNGNTVSIGSGSATVTVPASTDTLVGKATTDTLTNKTYNAESTGNVLTLPFTLDLPIATCDLTGPSATARWDMPGAAGVSAPTAACLSGTSNGPVGVLEFDDAATEYAYSRFRLPSDWTGSLDVQLSWSTTATSGNVVWQFQTTCVADDESVDASWNTAQTVTDAAKGTGGRLNTASLSSVTTTGCAAGELLKFRILRDPSHASDTIAATARLVGVEWTYRRAM